MSLTMCHKCNRTFNYQSLPIHEKNCQGKNPFRKTNKPNKPSKSDSEISSNDILNLSYHTIPKSNFVTCKGCGKTFTIHSIDKHRVACEKKAEHERQEQEQEAQRRHVAGPTHVARLPGVVCYVCGRNFGTVSIDIHEKMCLEKFRRENYELPKKDRRPEPVKPQANKETLEQMVKEKKLTGNKDYNQQAAMNDLNAAAYNQNLVQCILCKRTFNPDALKFHSKACTLKHPARKVGEVTVHV